MCNFSSGSNLEYVRIFLINKQNDKSLEGLSYAIYRIAPIEKVIEMLIVSLDDIFDKLQIYKFILLLLQNSKLITFDLLTDLKIAMRKQKHHENVIKILKFIDTGLARKSPIISRWNASPCADILDWMKWNNDDIGSSLYSLSLPFWQLRSHDFSTGSGYNLEHLNNIANSLSMFVATSIIMAYTVSKSMASTVASRWLNIAKYMLDKGNFHLLFAIHCGLCKHQLERLPNIISRRDYVFKNELDQLFEPNDRFQRVSELWNEQAGIQPTIIAVFWLVQKSTLLQETPLFDTSCDGINISALHATYNTFHILHLAQSVPPHEMNNTPPECNWYFLEVARGFKSCDQFEEYLYSLSDKVKTEGNKSISVFRSKSLPRKLSLDTDILNLKHRSAKHSVSAPLLNKN